MDQELMNMEDEVVVVETSGNEKLAIGMGVGALLTLAGIAGFKKVKKAIKKRRDRYDDFADDFDDEFYDDEEDVVEESEK